MKSETVAIGNNVFVAPHIEEMGYLIEAWDILPQEILDKSIVCKGHINAFSEISSVLTAFARRISEGADFHILLDKEILFKKSIENRIELLRIQNRVHFIPAMENYEKQCVECIELPSIALGNLYFSKKVSFAKNNIDDIYIKLAELGL